MISRDKRRAVIVGGGGLLLVAMAVWTVGRDDFKSEQEKLSETGHTYASSLWKGMWRNAGVAGPGHFEWPHASSVNAPATAAGRAQVESHHHQERARQQ
eukprot:464889-Hanusia_phi.AAC.1